MKKTIIHVTNAYPYISVRMLPQGEGPFQMLVDLSLKLTQEEATRLRDDLQRALTPFEEEEEEPSRACNCYPKVPEHEVRTEVRDFYGRPLK